MLSVNLSLFCNTKFIRDNIYWEGTVSIPRDWNSGLHEVLGLEPVMILIIFFWAKKTFFCSEIQMEEDLERKPAGRRNERRH